MPIDLALAELIETCEKIAAQQLKLADERRVLHERVSELFARVEALDGKEQ
jgi:hypothetical protein